MAHGSHGLHGFACRLTLRSVLTQNSVPVEEIVDLDRPIVNFAVEAEATWFAIAYHWADAGDSRVPDKLRNRLYERAKHSWTSAALDADAFRTGSVTHIRRQGRWMYIDTHLTPSAGSLLVLTLDLKVRRRLYGWTQILMADGRVVYGNSLVHFAPAHPGSLSLYDPRTDTDVPLYPSVRVETGSPEWLVDRSVASIEQVGRNRLSFMVVEQKVTLQRDNSGAPNGPSRTFRVTCDISAARPNCSQR